jgi:hypothetical protein
MSTRKQRYLLDVDDLVRSGFWSPTNADSTVQGINQNGTRSWSVARGGTNNGTFTDGRFIVFDQTRQAHVSSPYSIADLAGLLNFSNSGLYTGAVTVSGVNQTALSDTGVEVANLTAQLPTDGQWTWARVVFTSWITGPGALSNLSVALAGQVGLPTGWVCSYAGPWQVTVDGQESQIVWMAEGPIPAAVAADTLLAFTLSASGSGGVGDDTSRRGAYVIAYYRQAQAAPAPAVVHGVPTFLTNPVAILTNFAAATDWVTVDVTAQVPATASALLLEAEAHGGGLSYLGPLYIRPSGAGPQLTLLSKAKGGETSGFDLIEQGMFPFISTGGTCTFQYKVVVGYMDLTLRLVGYLS